MRRRPAPIKKKEVKMRRFLITLIVILQVLLVLLPVLSGEAPLPSSFSGQSIGSWFGEIFNYWQELFQAVQETIRERGGDL